jgi:hypothetical protein
MQNLFRNSIWGLAAVLAFLTVAVAQTTPPQRTDNPDNISIKSEKLSLNKETGGPAPKRDLNGAWAGPLPRVNIGPMTPLGLERYKANKPDGTQAEAGKQVPVGLSNDPLNTCDPLGFPRAIDVEARGFQFVQTPTAMWEMFQYQKVWREIWTDGRALPKNVGGTEKGAPDPRYYGYSVGHWEADDIFVVDTTGLDDGTWLNKVGYPHTAETYVHERYTRVDHDDLQLTITVDDPKLYAKPFVLATIEYKWLPDQNLGEQLCIPSRVIEYLRIIGDQNK